MFLSEYGVGYPEKNVLKRCWYNNPHGASISYLNVENTWTVKKGLMEWDAFWDAWQKENFKKEHTVLVHFRIATVGKDKTPIPGCTHPFPITDDENELNSLSYNAKGIVAHNGSIGAGEGELSDSQVAVRDHIYVLKDYMKKDKRLEKILYHLLEINSNRWFISDGENYNILGDWVEDKETRLLYSNDSFKSAIQLWGEKLRLPKQGYWRYKHQIDVEVPKEREKNYVPNTTTTTTTKQEVACNGNVWLAAQFYTDGKWDWDKWNSRDEKKTLLLPEKTETDAPKNNKKDYYSIYDSNNNLIGMVDNEGTVVWEEDAVKEENKKRCPQCSAEVPESYLQDNTCPYCYGDLDAEEYIACPNCKDINNIIDSSFDSGDCECLRCGAIFISTVDGEEAIVSWNMDTKLLHEELAKQYILNQ